MTEPAQPDFVFIRGTGRCGTTLLHGRLGAHPGLVGVPVDEILPEELADFGRRRLGAWSAAVDEGVLAEATRGYLTAYCRRLGGRDGIFLHKSTMRAHHLDTLLRWFPRCRIVYLVRHPLAVVESMINADLHRFRGRFGYRATVANSALRWANDILVYLRSRACRNPRLLQVRYEALTGDPDATLAAIQRFLGLPPAPCPVPSAPERYARRFVLERRERRWILDATAALVQQLGYDPQAWSEDVPAPLADRVADHADRRLRAVPPSLDGVELTRRALAEAARRGLEPVGLFGGGYLAQLVCPHLIDPPAEIAGVFDDDPLLVGRAIAGLAVHRPEAARRLGVRAVIPLTMVHQAALIERWRRRVGADVAVLPLWEETAAPAPAA